MNLPSIPSGMDIKKYKPTGLNLAATYWSPSVVGETKRLLFVGIKDIHQVDTETGETKLLLTAIFVDPETREVIHNASARLVGIFQREFPDTGTAFQITYKGKVKNSTNAFQSDSFEVYYLSPEQ